MAAASYRFSIGPWNLGQGAVLFDAVLDTAVALGFEGIQFHDDDAVPDLETLAPAQGTTRRSSGSCWSISCRRRSPHHMKARGVPTVAEPPLVAVILDAARPYDRRIIGGVAKHAREHGRWSLYVEEDPARKTARPETLAGAGNHRRLR